jgi:hypothetical protein
MRRKLTVGFTFALLLIFALSIGVMAQITSYDDTGSDTNLPLGGPSLICNGDFRVDMWTDMGPDCWALTPLESTDASGWVSHWVNMNMDVNRYDENRGLALFVRNTGGSGPYYRYATNELTGITAADDYWVQVHGSMFSEFAFFQIGNGALVQQGTVANSYIWYAITDEADPMAVDGSEWRELFVTSYAGPDVPGVVPCANPNEFCAQVGRYETVSIEPGDYMHLRAGMKFNPFNVWTVFEVDDIAISNLEADAEDLSGIDVIGDIEWEESGAR